MAQQQCEVSTLKSQLSMLQLSKDALQQSAKTAVLGLQSQVSEAQQLQSSASLALCTTKDEFQSMTETSDTFYLKLKQVEGRNSELSVAVEQLQQLYKKSEVKEDRLLDENDKLRIDARAADDGGEEQEDYISQMEGYSCKLQFKANGLQSIINHLMATYGLL